MNDLIIEEENLENIIYKVRGQEVMLDRDLARLFQCTNGSKSINQAVKRNPNKFPEDFCFQLTEEEKNNLWSQIGTANHMNRSLPYVFTEHGVVALAGVLRSQVADEMSVKISRAFVGIRHFLLEHQDIYKSLSNMNNKIDSQENKLDEHDIKLDYIFSKLGFNGKLVTDNKEINSYLISIFKEAKTKLIIIDPYLDNKVFNLLESIDVEVVLITSTKRNIDSDKYKVIKSDLFHDRYFIIDNKTVYLCGTSLNYIGNKISTIIKLEDSFIIQELLGKVNEIK